MLQSMGVAETKVAYCFREGAQTGSATSSESNKFSSVIRTYERSPMALSIVYKTISSALL